MTLNTVPTELTTAATDALLAVLCAGIIMWLWRLRNNDRWKTNLWCLVFLLVCLASALGTLAHGVLLGSTFQKIIWHPLYLFLGIAVALFLVGAIYDVFGKSSARKVLPWATGAGLVFYLLTVLFNGLFILFVLYEGIVMVSACILYAYLTLRKKQAGTGSITLAILFNMIASGVQASDLSMILVDVPFDHNGLFHLLQIIALILLAYGLTRNLMRSQNPAPNISNQHGPVPDQG